MFCLFGFVYHLHIYKVYKFEIIAQNKKICNISLQKTDTYDFIGICSFDMEINIKIHLFL